MWAAATDRRIRKLKIEQKSSYRVYFYKQEEITITRIDAYKTVFRDYPDVVTVDQMCEMLRISQKTGYKLLAENHINHIKIGRTYHIPKYSLFQYMNIIERHAG